MAGGIKLPNGVSYTQQEAQDIMNSVAANSVDPFYVLSTLLGTVSPSGRDAWQEIEARGPIGAQMLGQVMAPAGALGAAIKAAPRVAAGGAGIWGALAPSEAEGGSKKKQPAPEQPATQADLENDMDPLFRSSRGNPALEALYSQMKMKDQEATAPVKGVNAESSDRVRAAARDEAGKLRTQLIDKITELNPPKQSFEDAYPGVAQAWPFVQGAIGAGVGAVTKGVSNVIQKAATKPWNRAVTKAEEAINPGTVSRMMGKEADAAVAHQETQKAAEFLKDYEKGGFWRGLGNVADEVAPAATGAIAGAEANALKYRYNADNAPEGSPEQLAAKQALGDDMAATIGSGAALGAMGGATGAHLFGSLIPRGRPPVMQTRALMGRYEPRYVDDAVKMRASMEADARLRQPIELPAPQPPAGPSGIVAPAAADDVAGQQARTPIPTNTPSNPISSGPRVLEPVGPPAGPQSKSRASNVSKWPEQNTAAAREVLGELLANGDEVTRKTLIDALAKRLKIGPTDRNLSTKAGGTVKALDERSALGVDIYDPRIRQKLIDQITGRTGLLAIPATGAALPQEVIDELVAQIMAGQQ